MFARIPSPDSPPASAPGPTEFHDVLPLVATRGFARLVSLNALFDAADTFVEERPSLDAHGTELHQ